MRQSICHVALALTAAMQYQMLLSRSCFFCAAVECVDNPKWYDAEGRSCENYTSEPFLCSSVPGYLQGSHDNCCACSLASQPIESNSTFAPIPQPSAGPSAQPTVCYDLASWVDSAGDGCDWYTEPNKNRCTRFGNQYKNMEHVAKRACCGCGGGYYVAFRCVRACVNLIYCSSIVMLMCGSSVGMFSSFVVLVQAYNAMQYNAMYE
mmetsp:Transcript_23364/g.36018  ORF Transcript_23364/g.36018 Transcript_23364/m.36018 type:complete len:207 (-) Transcript_23364:124-744(-)